MFIKAKLIKEDGTLYEGYTYLNADYIKEINEIYDESNDCFVYTAFLDDTNFEYEISDEEMKRVRDR